MKLVFFIVLLPAILFADVLLLESTPQGLSFFDQLVQWISTAVNWTTLTGIGAVIFEFVARIFKTSKPVSIAWIIRDVSLQLAKVAYLVAQFMDKFLPQRLKEEALKTEAPKEVK